MLVLRIEEMKLTPRELTVLYDTFRFSFFLAPFGLIEGLREGDYLVFTTIESYCSLSFIITN